MASYTRYLATTAGAVNEFTVQLFDSPPVLAAQKALRSVLEIRYSPVMPAYLVPEKNPPPPPKNINSVSLIFANSPYKTLGLFKGKLRGNERARVYFTEGLASIVLLNFSLEQARILRKIAGNCPLEHWPLKAGKLSVGSIFLECPRPTAPSIKKDLFLPRTTTPELSVYVEQMSASIGCLWASYGIYFPQERETLRQIAIQASGLIRLYDALQKTVNIDGISCAKKKNSIISALVEISAALSYAVTQGTSGSLPVLSSRSPFPHHSLLGIGGAIRALTKYTRYLESAFMVRSASRVIDDQYSKIKHVVPASLSGYKSGPEYTFTKPAKNQMEYFDIGGKLNQKDNVPLVVHFSLRHGFMESKYSVTAASEALTAGTVAHWTLMTLSHEIMHSRVRAIFQALFGKEWAGSDGNLISTNQFKEFSKWIKTRKNPRKAKVVSSLRNVILHFCWALEIFQHPTPENQLSSAPDLTVEALCESYSRHKHFAIEIFVHFHDYYFVYARQPKVYVMSLWASWIKVAGPYVRPVEYLTRTLATLACGSGLESKAAYGYAKEILLDGLSSLEAAGIRSPLYGELRRLLSAGDENTVLAYFRPCYYLVDSVRLYFASRTIAAKIDQIDSDPFAEGSSSSNNYSASIYVYGEDHAASPVRYSLASLHKALSNELQSPDPQWLTAWNYMVISS